MEGGREEDEEDSVLYVLHSSCSVQDTAQVVLQYVWSL